MNNNLSCYVCQHADIFESEHEWLSCRCGKKNIVTDKLFGCMECTPKAGYTLMVTEDYSPFMLDTKCGECKYYKDYKCNIQDKPFTTSEDRRACYWVEKE